MRVHVVKHVPFEGPGAIAGWTGERGHRLTESLALTERYPDAGQIGLLVLMGGPMAADDERGNPWLVAEKRYVAEALSVGVPVLGVCLGAQVLADAIGGSVRRNPEREIGWYPVHKTEAGRRSALFADWPDELVVGHWHGDTFALPAGIEPCLSNDACTNQAFEVGGRACGLQFHLEWEPVGLAALVEQCRDELLGGGRWVSSADELRAGLAAHSDRCRQALVGLLDRLGAPEGVGDEGAR